MTSNIRRWPMPAEPLARDAALRDLLHRQSTHQHIELPHAFRGGRANALNKLNQINAEQYGSSRNFLNGAVTHLSPYLRHGCITLKEAVDVVSQRYGQRAEKLLFEFGWREYWRHVWYAQGPRIFHDMHAPKVQLGLNPMPQDVKTASTGLACMDAFVDDLAQSGYLHNHARMWLAAYVVHWRKTDWRLAADWMHDQLLDGDYASNHLSWQWIASTFSHKPYFFNQENLAKYTQNAYCQRCTADCPFRGSYQNLENKLFKPSQPMHRLVEEKAYAAKLAVKGEKSAVKGTETIVWVHDEMLNPNHALMQLPHQKIFILSPDYYQHWSMLRLQFIADCLAEMPEVSVWIGAPEDVLASLGVEKIVSQETPNHKLKHQVNGYAVTWHAEAGVFDAGAHSKVDLSSFSRFWKVAKPAFGLSDALNQDLFV